MFFSSTLSEITFLTIWSASVPKCSILDPSWRPVAVKIASKITQVEPKCSKNNSRANSWRNVFAPELFFEHLGTILVDFGLILVDIFWIWASFPKDLGMDLALKFADLQIVAHNCWYRWKRQKTSNEVPKFYPAFICTQLLMDFGTFPASFFRFVSSIVLVPASASLWIVLHSFIRPLKNPHTDLTRVIML